MKSLFLVLALAGVCVGADQKPHAEEQASEEPWSLLPVPNIKLKSKDEATAADAKIIRGLIADLAKIENPEDGFSPSLIGNAFSPVRALRNSGMGVPPNSDLKRCSAFTSLVEVGPRALPILLESLDDKTPTKIAIKKYGNSGGMYFGYPIRGNRANKHENETWNGGIADKDNNKAPPDLTPVDDFPWHWTYTVKVGDLCFAAVGQITNRSYNVVNYQPTGCFYINSTVEDKSLAAKVRVMWGKSDYGQKLIDSLLLDFYTRGDGSDHFQVGAAMRLAYYYPEETEDIIIAKLKDMETAMMERSKGSANVWNEEFMQAVSWTSRPKIRAELHKIIRKSTDSKAHSKATPD